MNCCLFLHAADRLLSSPIDSRSLDFDLYILLDWLALGNLVCLRVGGHTAGHELLPTLEVI